MLDSACHLLTAYAAPPYRVVTITTDPPKGPHSLGTTVKLQCRVTPPPPEGAIYSWTDSIPSTSLSSAQPNLTLTIPVHHPSQGDYYCTVYNGSSVLGVGSTTLTVRSELDKSYLLIVLWARVAGKIKANNLQQLTIRLHINIGSFYVKSTHTQKGSWPHKFQS